MYAEESDLGESLTEAVNEQIKKSLTDLLSLYAEKQDISGVENNCIRIFTIMNNQVPNKEKGHEEMIAILKKNGYQVKSGTCLYNPLVKQHMSFIDIANKPAANVQESKASCQEDGCDKKSDLETDTIEENLFENIDEIQESALETLISSSLVEAYGNVAGFRLTECTYADNKFKIDGTIYFTSGNTRKTTYTFSESTKSDEKISLCGLNEKLGLEKQFMLTGRIDNKTLITESFKRNK